MQTTPPLLRIVDLGHGYAHGGQEETIFCGLQAEVRQGELLCLIGRSGCGKSTLLKIIAGFLAPSQGCCLLDGHPITRPGPDRGVVFQEDALFPWLRRCAKTSPLASRQRRRCRRHCSSPRWDCRSMATIYPGPCPAA